MKKLLAAAAHATVSTMAMAERYVMITHAGTDPFWPVVEKGGRDAAAALVQSSNTTLTHQRHVRHGEIDRSRSGIKPRWHRCIPT